MLTRMLDEVYSVDESFLGALINELCNVNEIEKAFQIYIKMIDVNRNYLRSNTHKLFDFMHGNSITKVFIVMPA